MNNAISLVQNDNVPASFKFQINFNEASKNKSYFDIASNFKLLDGYVDGESDVEDLNSFNLTGICDKFPHLNEFKDKLEIVKNNYLYLTGLYQILPQRGMTESVNLREYCIKHKMIVMEIVEQPIIFVSSVSQYLSLIADISNHSLENEVVFWLDINGYLRSDTNKAEASNSTTELTVLGETSFLGYHIAITKINEIECELEKIENSTAIQAETVADAYELPSCSKILVDVLSAAEQSFTHQIHFWVDDCEISKVQCNNREIISDHNWEGSEMYRAFKGLLSHFNISTANLISNPLNAFFVLNMPHSPHSSDEYELGLSIQSVTTAQGYTVTLNLLFSSEFSESSEVTSNIAESKLNIVFGSAKDDPVSQFSKLVNAQHQLAGGSSMIAYEKSFPIYIDDISHCSINNNIETFIEYAAIGIECLVMGQVNTPEVADMALLAAQAGLTVIGYSYSSNHQAAINRLKFTQSLYEPSSLGVSETIGELVELIPANNSSVQSEG